MKKLVYVLNSFSPNEASHFWHVVELLEELAGRGVNVLLVVEKGGAVPTFRHPGIHAVALQAKFAVSRYLQLFRRVREGVRGSGQCVVYTRIAAPSALVATFAC